MRTGDGVLCCTAGRKSCAITTARRLGEFLGDERIKVGAIQPSLG